MKTSYRKASELTGLIGVSIRGKILDKIVSEFYRQPNVRAEAMEAIALGLTYFVSVLAVIVIFSLPLFFLLPVGGVALYFAGVLFPTKTFYVYVSGRIDEEFEL